MKLQHIFYCISKQNNKIRCTQPTCLLIILRILFGPFADQKKGGGLKKKKESAVVAHTFNLSTWQADLCGLEVSLV